jgi:nitroreductase
MQNWRFVVVRDTELRKQIRAAAVDQAQVTDASLLIVLTADLNAWKKSPERYWRNAAPEIQKLVTGWMGPFYEGKEQLQRDEAMRSVGIVGQTIMLAAKAMGYDSCPMIGFDQAKVAEIINLPSDHVVGFMIAVGKAVKPAVPADYRAPEDLEDRLILPLVNEAVSCLADGTVADADLLDAGVIFGTGFAPFRGGPIAHARAAGPANLKATLEALAAKHGDRFKPRPGWDAL